MNQRIMVDMSATLLHHGHIRLLSKAADIGTVIVALATDEAILEAKGYEPELTYCEREEVIKSVRYVDEVVPAPWVIDDEFLDRYQADYLFHGEDNFNKVSPHRIKLTPRTTGISSTEMRVRVLKSIGDKLLRGRIK